MFAKGETKPLGGARMLATGDGDKEGDGDEEGIV